MDLTNLLGSWTGTEELAASPWAPAGSARASTTYHAGVDGKVVIQDYEQHRDGGQRLLGHGVFLIDPDSGDTLWYFFDSYGYPVESPARGGWQGDTLVLEKTTPRGVARHRFTPTRDELRHEVDIRMGDGEVFRPFLRGAYSRRHG